MSHKVKIDRTAMLIVILLTGLFFFLSACSPSVLVCATGLCPSIRERMLKIPWNPPSLDYQDCPDISGKYKAAIYESTIPAKLMSQFPQTDDKFNFIHSTLTREGGKEIPQGRFIPKPEKGRPKAGIWDQSEFYNNAYVLITQNEQYLVISLMGREGDLYIKQTINMHSPMIGCADRYLIIRVLVPPGGTEFGYTAAYARESRFKKLADGSLKRVYYSREWYYDDVLGLTGVNEDGSDNSNGTPREKIDTLVFQSVP
jgi:hypothetical protein